jgi:hypothetical protein
MPIVAFDAVITLLKRHPEQHQPGWNSRSDKVSRENNEMERADRLRSA